MRLTANETKITIEGTSVVLRPSLWAAYQLLATDGALLALLDGISDFDTAVVSRLIRESATDEDEAEHFIAAMLYGGLVFNHAAISGSLVQHVMALIGTHGREAKAEVETEAKQVSIAEYLEELFSIGTGWLHWTPETTWNATPAEILAAHAGHMKMLQVLYGSPSEPTNEPHWERDEASFAELKALAGRMAA